MSSINSYHYTYWLLINRNETDRVNEEAKLYICVQVQSVVKRWENVLFYDNLLILFFSHTIVTPRNRMRRRERGKSKNQFEKVLLGYKSFRKLSISFVVIHVLKSQWLCGRIFILSADIFLLSDRSIEHRYMLKHIKLYISTQCVHWYI